MKRVSTVDAGRFDRTAGIGRDHMTTLQEARQLQAEAMRWCGSLTHRRAAASVKARPDLDRAFIYREPVTIAQCDRETYEAGQTIANLKTRREYLRQHGLTVATISALNAEWHKCQAALARQRKLMK